MVSIIITYHEEGLEFLKECLTQLKDSIDIIKYEIIVVDDCSKEILPEIEDVKIIRNENNIGVGRSFDVGVEQANGEDIILTACDMRFIPNNWVSKLIKEINDNPKSLICTACIGLNKDRPENMDFEIRRKVLRCYGATILMFHDKQSNHSPRITDTFRGIIEAKWYPLKKDSINKSYEIPCILGACYGVKKEWYQYIDGFWGHRQWGTLEPYISLKSWLFGGNCLVAPHIETAHIFKKEGSHGITQDNVMFNKLLVATLLLEDSDRFINFLGSNQIVERAKKLFEELKISILNKREEYKSKIVVDIKEFCKKFKIDLRMVNPLSKEYDGIYERKEYYQCHYSKAPYFKVWSKVASYIKDTDVVVELGCGTGQLLEMLLDKGIAQYTGYDFSQVGVELAKSKITKPIAEVYWQDLYEMNSLPTASVYIAVEVLEHLVEDIQVLKLIPKGKQVIITVPNYLGGSHVRKFDTEEEVKDRYKDIIKCSEISTITYGSGKIFVMLGVKL